MLYFAYGSNMDPVQMKERCKDDPKVVGIAVLPEYELCFPRRSVKRNCGVASVAEKPGAATWGVVYDLSVRDAEALNANEGFKVGRDASLNSYNCVEINVLMNGVATAVTTYIATAEETPSLPSLAYLTHIRQGARHHKLPYDYLTFLDFLVHQ